MQACTTQGTNGTGLREREVAGGKTGAIVHFEGVPPPCRSTLVPTSIQEAYNAWEASTLLLFARCFYLSGSSSTLDFLVSKWRTCAPRYPCAPLQALGDVCWHRPSGLSWCPRTLDGGSSPGSP